MALHSQESIQSMPAAVPGIGDCNICLQAVPCVKVLDCNHTLCIPCASRLIIEANKTKISCAECRQLTDVSKGVSNLRTIYFGKIRCDVCLEKKDAEDTWWCKDCLMALCSKCSIKEHSNKKSHNISEWNRLEQVSFSVSFIDGLKTERQHSHESQRNERAITAYFQSVMDNFRAELRNSNSDLDHLRQSLIARYGSRFSDDSDGPTTPAPEDGPRVVAKVLQIAGENVMESFLPSPASAHSNSKPPEHQLYFTKSPQELAQYIRQHVKFIPVHPDDESGGGGSDQGTLTPNNTPSISSSGGATPQYPDVVGPSSGAASSSAKAESVIARVGGQVPVLQMIYCAAANIVALRTGTEIQLYNTATGKTYGIPMQKQSNIRDVCFGDATGELLACYQSTLRKYEWTMESFRLDSFPVTSSYSAAFDIDPEDRVDSLHLSLTGEGDGSTLYQVRHCAQNVSEIWRATTSKKKGKVKLHEKMVYQKPDSRYTDLRVLCHGKERYIFAWDDMSSCLFRLIVKDNGRCESSTKILHSSEQIPYSIDNQRRIWLYDPHLGQVCVSRNTVINRENVLFHEVWQYQLHGFSALYWLRSPDSLLGLSLTPDAILLTTFEKD